LKRFLLFLLICSSCFAQTHEQDFTHYTAPELLLGSPLEPTDEFPELSGGKSFFLHFAKSQKFNASEWAYRLKYPNTGMSYGFTNFGNEEILGYAFTVMPFIEFPILKSKRFKGLAGLGGSYFTEQFDIYNNLVNEADNSDLTWSFRLFLSYDIVQSRYLNWKVGAGYFHHSNGHTRLPNLGLNSLQLSTSLQINDRRGDVLTAPQKTFTKTIQNYFQVRTGLGQSVLSIDLNDKREVYSLAVSAGRIYNKTFKFGIGAYYRFYEHYYDYIKNDGEVVNELYPYFKDAPFYYATNIGVYGSGEILLGNFAIEAQLGINIFKPFYKVDRFVSQYFRYIENTPQGDVVRFLSVGKLDDEYELKRAISSRLGLKYYFISPKKSPKFNVFVGATLNANAGQADFSEASIGFVYSYNLRETKY
jgi:hypothetical protein